VFPLSQNNRFVLQRQLFQIQISTYNYWHHLQLLRRENPQQVPSKVKTVKDIPVIVGTLSDELVLELLEEVQVQEIIWSHGLLSDHSLHGHGVLSDSVVGVELVGDFGVIGPGHALADSRLHQP